MSNYIDFASYPDIDWQEVMHYLPDQELAAEMLIYQFQEGEFSFEDEPTPESVREYLQWDCVAGCENDYSDFPLADWEQTNNTEEDVALFLWYVMAIDDDDLIEELTKFLSAIRNDDDDRNWYSKEYLDAVTLHCMNVMDYLRSFAPLW